MCVRVRVLVAGASGLSIDIWVGVAMSGVRGVGKVCQRFSVCAALGLAVGPVTRWTAPQLATGWVWHS